MSDVDGLVATARGGDLKPVYLFSGDEYLVGQAAQSLVDGLVPASARDFNLASLDGAAVDGRAIAGHLAQAPMFPGVKLVVVHQTTLLTGKSDLAAEVARASRLLEDGKPKDAARRMLAVLGRAGWTVADLTEATKKRWKSDLGVDGADVDPAFSARIREVAEAEGLSVPEGDTEALERLLEKGPPAKNALVLTCDKPDKRLALTKLIAKVGVHLHLVAEQRGRDIESLDIGAVTESVLGRHGKRLDRGAEAALKRAIGGELRLLAGELEKLCLYVGDAPVITAADVEAVGVTRVREEAFWELGNAVVGRDLASALWYVHDALDHGRHPIPMVASIASGLRKALEVRSVADRHGVRRGVRKLPQGVVDEVAARRGGRPPHPFALLKEWERSLQWPGTESLVRGLAACQEADLALKSSGGDPRLVVERLLVQLATRD